MSIVDVASVPHIEWNFSDNSAEEEVKLNLEIIRQAVADAELDLDTALNSLTRQITSASMPHTHIKYSYLSDDIEVERPDTKPTAPNFPSTAGIVKPERGELQDVTIPVFPDVPTFGITAPTDTIDYTEVPYDSDLLESLKSHVYNWISNGGIELDQIIQTAIDSVKARRRADLEEEYDKQMTIAVGLYPSMGWNLNNGAQNSIISKANNEHNKRVDAMEAELTAMEAEWKIKNRQFLLTFAKELEAMLIDQADKTAKRLFETAKTTVELLYDIYKSRVTAYVAEVQGVSTEIDAKSKIIDSQLQINKSISEIYKTDMDGYRTEISAVVDVIDGQAKVYAAEMGGYSEDIKWANGIMASRIEKLKALISQSTNQTELQVKEAEVKLQAYINSLGLNIETSKAVAGFLTQVLASSLGALNTHVTMTDGTSRNFGSSYTHSENLGNTKHLNESHTYDDTKDK